MSDSERREIAARLRDFDSLRPVFEESAICGFLDVLDIGYLDWEGVCGRLAELIEPEPERTYMEPKPCPICGGEVMLMGKRVFIKDLGYFERIS